MPERLKAQRDFMVRFAELITLGIHVGLSREEGIDIIMKIITSRVDLNRVPNWYDGELGREIMDEIERQFLSHGEKNSVH
jgi:hypothetical protein